MPQGDKNNGENPTSLKKPPLGKAANSVGPSLSKDELKKHVIKQTNLNIKQTLMNEINARELQRKAGEHVLRRQKTATKNKTAKALIEFVMEEDEQLEAKINELAAAKDAVDKTEYAKSERFSNLVNKIEPHDNTDILLNLARIKLEQHREKKNTPIMTKPNNTEKLNSILKHINVKANTLAASKAPSSLANTQPSENDMSPSY